MLEVQIMQYVQNFVLNLQIVECVLLTFVLTSSLFQRVPMESLQDEMLPGVWPHSVWKKTRCGMSTMIFQT